MRRLCALALVLFSLTGCIAGGAAADGYYSAEAEDFDAFGWREYVTIFVNGGKIASVEYNAFNASGLLKSWDMEYMREMAAVSGTYPNEYMRRYASAFLAGEPVDAVAGATHSFNSFVMLSTAAVERARAGDASVAIVKLPEYESEE